MAETPIVGLLGSLNVDNTKQSLDTLYISAVKRCGLLPLVLPYEICDEDVEKYLSILDGLVFCGGNDVNPKYYNEEQHEKLGELVNKRDETEFLVFKKAMEKSMPILGICRGMQLINVALGGTLVQDIPSYYKEHLIHSSNKDEYNTFHDIKLVEGTPAYKWAGATVANVNTYHHQCVKDIANDLIVSALSEDGIIESYYSEKYKNIIAVQWHPEREDTNINNAIFSDFYKLCIEYKKEKL